MLGKLLLLLVALAAVEVVVVLTLPRLGHNEAREGSGGRSVREEKLGVGVLLNEEEVVVYGCAR